MRAISKHREPTSLAEHRQKSHSSFDSLDKTDVKASLLTEQDALCCYCMTRIKSHSMKIEHWMPQSAAPNLALSYTNLLGACLGGEGERLSAQHCDTRKGSQKLSYNPAESTHAIESRIIYQSNGRIDSSDGPLREELDTVLNLNVARLCAQREASYRGMQAWLKGQRTRRKGPVPAEILRRKLRKVQDDAEPFCGVAEWLLKRKLK